MKRSTTYDFLALGEALVDFISTDIANSLGDATNFTRFVGGQAANLSMNMARLGKRSAIAACVGHDSLGTYIRKEIEKVGVNCYFMQTSKEAATTIVTVTRQTQTPDFIVHRGADAFLRPTKELTKAVSNCQVLHTSAFALSREPARTTILNAIQIAKEMGILISLDPNFHHNIWPDAENFEDILKLAFTHVDITKPSIEDCSRLFGSGNKPLEYAQIFLDWGARIVLISMGEGGVYLATRDGDAYQIIGNPNIPVADVTGAGDAYWAGFISSLLEGDSPLDAACMGQVIAEIKISQIGPINNALDREALINQAHLVKHERIEM